MASQAVSLDNRQHRTYSPTFYFDHAVAGEDRGSGATEPNRVLCTRFTDKVWGPFLKQQQSGVNDVTPWVVLNDTVDGVPAAETEAFKTDAVNAAKKFLNLDGFDKDLPADPAPLDALEEFMIVDTDTRVLLRGQRGLRTKQPLAQGVVLGFLRGTVMTKTEYRAFKTADAPADGERIQDVSNAEEWAYLRRVQRSLAIKGCVHKFTAEDLPQVCKGLELHLSCWDEGNVLTRINAGDAVTLPLPGVSPEDKPAKLRSLMRPNNAALVEIFIRGWPYLMVITTCPIDVGEEILMSYGDSFWKELHDAGWKRVETQAQKMKRATSGGVLQRQLTLRSGDQVLRRSDGSSCDEKSSDVQAPPEQNAPEFKAPGAVRAHGSGRQGHASGAFVAGTTGPVGDARPNSTTEVLPAQNGRADAGRHREGQPPGDGGGGGFDDDDDDGVDTESESKSGEYGVLPSRPKLLSCKGLARTWQQLEKPIVMRLLDLNTGKVREGECEMHVTYMLPPNATSLGFNLKSEIVLHGFDKFNPPRPRLMSKLNAADAVHLLLHCPAEKQNIAYRQMRKTMTDNKVASYGGQAPGGAVEDCRMLLLFPMCALATERMSRDGCEPPPHLKEYFYARIVAPLPQSSMPAAPAAAKPVQKAPETVQPVQPSLVAPAQQQPLQPPPPPIVAALLPQLQIAAPQALVPQMAGTALSQEFLLQMVQHAAATPAVAQQIMATAAAAAALQLQPSVAQPAPQPDAMPSWLLEPPRGAVVAQAAAMQGMGLPMPSAAATAHVSGQVPQYVVYAESTGVQQPASLPPGPPVLKQMQGHHEQYRGRRRNRSRSRSGSRSGGGYDRKRQRTSGDERRPHFRRGSRSRSRSRSGGGREGRRAGRSSRSRSASPRRGTKSPPRRNQGGRGMPHLSSMRGAVPHFRHDAGGDGPLGRAARPGSARDRTEIEAAKVNARFGELPPSAEPLDAEGQVVHFLLCVRRLQQEHCATVDALVAACPALPRDRAEAVEMLSSSRCSCLMVDVAKRYVTLKPNASIPQPPLLPEALETIMERLDLPHESRNILRASGPVYASSMAHVPVAILVDNVLRVRTKLADCVAEDFEPCDVHVISLDFMAFVHVIPESMVGPCRPQQLANLFSITTGQLLAMEVTLSGRAANILLSSTAAAKASYVMRTCTDSGVAPSRTVLTSRAFYLPTLAQGSTEAARGAPGEAGAASSQHAPLEQAPSAGATHTGPRDPRLKFQQQ